MFDDKYMFDDGGGFYPNGDLDSYFIVMVSLINN
jgi:hypothetical protein